MVQLSYNRIKHSGQKGGFPCVLCTPSWSRCHCFLKASSVWAMHEWSAFSIAFSSTWAVLKSRWPLPWAGFYHRVLLFSWECLWTKVWAFEDNSYKPPIDCNALPEFSSCLKERCVCVCMWMYELSPSCVFMWLQVCVHLWQSQINPECHSQGSIHLNFWKYWFLFYVYEYLSAYVCICNTCNPGAYRGQEQVSDPLERDLQTVVSCGVGARNGTQLLCKISRCS